MEAILSNSTRKLLWFEITKMVIPVKNTFILLFIVIFGTLSFSTQWWRQSSGKQSHTWQYCCLPSYAFNCASVSWRSLQSVQRFQFFTTQGLHLFTCTQHFHSDTLFHNYIIVLQKSSTRCDANYTLSVQCHYNTTPVTPCSTEHFLKCLLTSLLRLYSRSHKQQENCLYSECTEWWSLNSVAVQKRFGHSLQTYGFTASCRWTCALSWCLLPNFFWQMSQENQVPSLCDFSRCVLSWWRHVKQSEQCLHEYGFASVWIRTWSFSSMWVLKSFPQ